MADNTDAIKNSFAKTQMGMQDQMANALDKAATESFGSAGKKFAGFFTKHLSDAFDINSPAIQKRLGTDVAKALSESVRQGSITLSSEQSKIVEELLTGETKLLEVREDLQKSVQGYLDTEKEIIGQLKKEDVSGFFADQSDDIKEQFKDLSDTVSDQWGNMIASLPAVALLAVAGEAQDDMASTIITQTGFVTKAFDDYNSVVSETTALMGLTQDQALAVTNTFYSQGLQFQFNKDQILGLNKSTADMSHLFDMAADEAAQLVMHMTRMGMSKSDIDKATKSAFELGTALGLPQADMKEMMTTSADLVSLMAFAGPEANQKMTASLMKLNAGYRQMGLDSGDALSTLNDVITGSEQGRLLTTKMANYFGTSFGDMLNVAETEGDKFIAMRNQLATDTMFEKAGMTVDDLLNLDPTELKNQFSHIQQIMGPQLEEIYGMSKKEIALMTRAFTSSTEDQRLEIEKLAADGKSAGEILNALMVPKEGEGRTMDEGLESFNKLATTMLGQLKNIGHAFLMMVGMPLLQVITPALGFVVDMLKALYSVADSIPGLFEVLGAVIGIFSAVTLARLVIASGSAVVGIFGLGMSLMKTNAQFIISKTLMLGSYIPAMLASGVATGALASGLTVLSSIGAVVSTGMAAVGTVIAGITLPIWATIAAVIAAGVAIYALWDNWDTVSSWLRDSWKTISGLASGLSDSFGDLPDTVGAMFDALRDKGMAFIDFITGIPGRILDAFGSLKDIVLDTITAPLSAATDLFSSFFDDTPDELSTTVLSKSEAQAVAGSPLNTKAGTVPVVPDTSLLAQPDAVRTLQQAETMANLTSQVAVGKADTSQATNEAIFDTGGMESKLDTLIGLIAGDATSQAAFRELLTRKLRTGGDSEAFDLMRAGAI